MHLDTVRKRASRRGLIAWISVFVHVVACLALMAAAGGTEIVPDMAERMRWVASHPILWAATWAVWACASMSLSAFSFVWSAEILERGGSKTRTIGGLLLIVLGLLFDLAGETVNMTWPLRRGLTVEEFAWGARLYGIASAGTANGLYCLGGIVLSVQCWQIGWLRGWIGILGIAMWTVGICLTAMVVVDYGPGMIAAGAVVMALYIPWTAVVGWKLAAGPAGASTGGVGG